MSAFAATTLVGIGATALTDVWGLLRQRLFGVPAPDYGMVGRWIAHMPRGRFRHDRIASAQAVRGERVVGWLAHYLIGIAFAASLVAVTGPAWLRDPSFGPALAMGLVTVAAPFLVMQPAMGAGFFASRTPRPNLARVHSIALHAVFGLGLYLAAEVVRLSLGA